MGSFCVLMLLLDLRETPCAQRLAPKPPRQWNQLEDDLYSLSEVRTIFWKRVSSRGRLLFSVSKKDLHPETEILKDQTTVRKPYGSTSSNRSSIWELRKIKKCQKKKKVMIGQTRAQKVSFRTFFSFCFFENWRWKPSRELGERRRGWGGGGVLGSNNQI